MKAAEPNAVYKIRHIPTGLFYKPSKHMAKSNLSKNGKIYNSKPTLKWLGDIYQHPKPRSEGYPYWESRTVILSDWEIVAYPITGAEQ